MNQRERKNKGLAYVVDDALNREMLECRKLVQKFNTSDWTDLDKLSEIAQEILGKSEKPFILPPFRCDYGSNIEVGKNFVANYNCTILDVAKVRIGDNCMFAPNVSIYTAGHPIHSATRNSGYEYGKEITIGDNVWIGGNSVVCPGVTIGNNVVIGAGSVVTKDIPDWCVAAGNPCKVIRSITEDDRRKLFKNELIDDEAWDDIVEHGYAARSTNMNGIIFDVDGTLWDSTEQMIIAWNEAVEKYTDLGKTFVADDLKREFGKPLDVIVRNMLPELDEVQQDQVLKYVFKYGNGRVETEPCILYDRMPEVIRTLSERYPLFIVSNCQAGYIEAFLNNTKLGAYITDYTCPGDTGKLKANNIRLIMERNHLEHAVYVGDTQGDAEACEEAGVPMIYAAYGFGEVKKDHVTIETFSELLTMDYTQFFQKF